MLIQREYNYNFVTPCETDGKLVLQRVKRHQRPLSNGIKRHKFSGFGINNEVISSDSFNGVGPFNASLPADETQIRRLFPSSKHGAGRN